MNLLKVLKFLLVFAIIFIKANTQLASGESCTTIDGSSGVCKFILDCPAAIDLVRRHQNKKIKVCDNFKRIVCCPNAEMSQNLSAEQPLRISEKKCKIYAKNLIKPVTSVSLMLGGFEREITIDKCKHKGVSLIFGGIEAKEAEFPHQALLGYDQGRADQWVCGGSLISPNFILTAAHCLFSSFGKVKFVKLGINYRSQVEGVLTFGVAETFKYSYFSERNNNHDIALLKLNGTVQFSEFISPICLPTKDYNAEKATVSGLGLTETDRLSEKLMKATLEKFSYEDCQHSFDSLATIDRNTMLCYGDHIKERDSCNGDSGGPLQIDHDSINCTYIQVGIVSFGMERCGLGGIPGVYVNVFKYLDWIEHIVWHGEK